MPTTRSSWRAPTPVCSTSTSSPCRKLRLIRTSKSAAVLAALFLLAGCGAGSGGCAIGFGTDSTRPAPGAKPRIVLNVDSPRPTIDILDVPSNILVELGTLESREAWTTVLKVAVGPDQLATVGQYSIEGDRIRFTPMFPLDRGRQYHVTFT